NRLLDRLPVFLEELVEILLVLRTGEGAELHQAANLLHLELGARRVSGLGGVVRLPGARADLRHDAAEPRLDHGHVLERHVTMARPDGGVLHGFLITHASAPPARRHNRRLPTAQDALADE